jgi:hypothetical protein
MLVLFFVADTPSGEGCRVSQKNVCSIIQIKPCLKGKKGHFHLLAPSKKQVVHFLLQLPLPLAAPPQMLVDARNYSPLGLSTFVHSLMASN